jgi:hypothetical protein
MTVQRKYSLHGAARESETLGIGAGLELRGSRLRDNMMARSGRVVWGTTTQAMDASDAQYVRAHATKPYRSSQAQGTNLRCVNLRAYLMKHRVQSSTHVTQITVTDMPLPMRPREIRPPLRRRGPV